MILALIALLSSAEAHPLRYAPPPVVIHAAVAPHREIHWVEAHFDRWGRWIPGHWISNIPQDVIDCRIDRRGIVSCIVR